jgi:hypothetical protein
LAKGNPHQIRTVITFCEERVKQRAANIASLQSPLPDAQPIPIALLNAILEAIYRAVAEGAAPVDCHPGLTRAPPIGDCVSRSVRLGEIRGCDLQSPEAATEDRAFSESDL